MLDKVYKNLWVSININNMKCGIQYPIAVSMDLSIKCISHWSFSFWKKILTVIQNVKISKTFDYLVFALEIQIKRISFDI